MEKISYKNSWISIVLFLYFGCSSLFAIRDLINDRLEFIVEYSNLILIFLILIAIIQRNKWLILLVKIWISTCLFIPTIEMFNLVVTRGERFFSISYLVVSIPLIIIILFLTLKYVEKPTRSVKISVRNFVGFLIYTIISTSILFVIPEVTFFIFDSLGLKEGKVSQIGTLSIVLTTLLSLIIIFATFRWMRGVTKIGLENTIAISYYIALVAAFVIRGHVTGIISQIN